jgi:Ca-activated chloride channel family protein
MSFDAPYALLALLALPPAAAVYCRRQRRPRRDALRFPGVDTLLAALPPRPAWRRHLPAVLYGLAVAGLLVAVARPQRSVAVPTRHGAVMLVTDVSGSMDAEDVSPTRLDAARAAANRFLDKAPDRVLVGALAFSSEPEAVMRPTRDRDEVRDLLGELQAGGNTATGDALAAALRVLRPEGHRRAPPAAIVLLSDGARTTGRDPVPVARQARRLGVPVTTVSLGTPGGVVGDPALGAVRRVPPDPETMREVADASGGRAFEVEEAGELRSVYEHLGTQLTTRRERREVTWAFAGAGALLLAAAVALSARRFGRVA